MEASVDCSNALSQTYLFGITSLVWLGVLIAWDLNARHYNSNHVNTLHKAIGATVLLKLLLSFFSFMARISCSSETFLEYWVLAEGCTFCLFNTFLFITFLLISKGFCYTRDYFDRDETNILAITTGGIYIVFSIYLMQSGWLILLILTTVSIMWFKINKNSNEMILTLKRKIQYMRNYNLVSSLPAAEKKLKMIQNFSNIFQIFMTIFTFGCIWDFFMYFTNDFSKFMLFLSIEEINDFFGLVSVCVIFWPKFNGQYFDLAEFEGENEDRLPIEMFESDGKGIDAITESEDNQKFMIKQPFTDNNDYSNYLIALPMSLKYHQDFDSYLEEPLLPRP